MAWHLPAETGAVRQTYLFARAGQGGPLHACHAGANAGPHALRLQHLNPVGSIGGIANAGSCASAVGVRDRAGSCATCKPPSDRHRRTGSTRRSFSRDEGRRLAFRKCRRAWPSRRELKTKAACGLRPLIPGALDKAAAAAYGVATAHPAGPAAAPAGAPGCGRGSTAM